MCLWYTESWAARGVRGGRRWQCPGWCLAKGKPSGGPGSHHLHGQYEFQKLVCLAKPLGTGGAQATIASSSLCSRPGNTAQAWAQRFGGGLHFLLPCWSQAAWLGQRKACMGWVVRPGVLRSCSWVVWSRAPPECIHNLVVSMCLGIASPPLNLPHQMPPSPSQTSGYALQCCWREQGQEQLSLSSWVTLDTSPNFSGLWSSRTKVGIKLLCRRCAFLSRAWCLSSSAPLSFRGTGASHLR